MTDQEQVSGDQQHVPDNLAHDDASFLLRQWRDHSGNSEGVSIVIWFLEE